MADLLRVVLLEDREADAELVLAELRRAGFDPAWTRVDTAAAYAAALAGDAHIDVVLADYRLPQFDAPRALEHLQRSGRTVPFIVVSGTIGDEQAASLIKQGAADYVLKDRLARLGAAIRTALETQRLRQQKRRDEEALRESEERTRLILQNALDAVITADSDGRIIAWNPQAERLFGWSEAEALGRLLSDTIVPRPYRDAHDQGLERFRTTGEGPVLNKRIELTACRRDGTEFPVELAITPIRVQGSTVFSAFLRDITERKQAQESLSRYAERLRILHEVDRALIAEAAPVEIAAAAIEWFRDLLGVPRAVVNVFDVAAGQSEWLAAAGRRRILRAPGVRFPLALMGDVDALRRDEVQLIDVATLPPSREAEALRAAGIRGYVVVPMIAAGELIGGLSFGGDSADFPPEQLSIAREVAAQLAIALAQARLYERVKRQAEELEQRVRERTAELVAAQEGLVRAERLAILGRLAGGVSHELRNPLGVITNSIYYLRLVFPEQDKARKHLSIIDREVATANRIITGLLDFARAVPPDRTPTDLSQLVREHLEEVRLPDGIAAAADLSRDLPRLAVDANQVRLVVGNLITNAVQAMPDGGTLTIRTAWTDGTVRLTIEDTGVGIPSENLEKIWEPLFSTKAKGIGFGLSVVKSLTEANGGSITVDSTVGHGSRFAVSFPAAPGG